MAFPREYRGAYLERRRACGFRLYEAVGVARGDREAYAKQGFENYRLFGAAHVAIVTSDEALGTYGAVDCGAYVNKFPSRGAEPRRRFDSASGTGLAFEIRSRAFWSRRRAPGRLRDLFRI
jgi:hypothetical protein